MRVDCVSGAGKGVDAKKKSPSYGGRRGHEKDSNVNLAYRCCDGSLYGGGHRQGMVNFSLQVSSTNGAHFKK